MFKFITHKFLKYKKIKNKIQKNNKKRIVHTNRYCLCKLNIFELENVRFSAVSKYIFTCLYVFIIYFVYLFIFLS